MSSSTACLESGSSPANRGTHWKHLAFWSSLKLLVINSSHFQELWFYSFDELLSFCYFSLYTWWLVILYYSSKSTVKALGGCLWHCQTIVSTELFDFTTKTWHKFSQISHLTYISQLIITCNFSTCWLTLIQKNQAISLMQSMLGGVYCQYAYAWVFSLHAASLLALIDCNTTSMLIQTTGWEHL